MECLRTVVLKREKGRTQLPDFQEGFSEKVPEIAFARWSRNLLPYYRQNKIVRISEGLLPAIKNEKL
jgi:hypothetical protein